jgi:hypothetical protein
MAPVLHPAWQNSAVLDAKGSAKGQRFSIWATAAAAVLAASCAALTATPMYASQVHTQARRPSAPYVTVSCVSGGGRVVLLSSTLAVRPHSGSASSPRAVPRIPAAHRLISPHLRHYLVLALLVIALTCLIALITLRVRRRRASARQPLEGVRGPVGRHAVAGPAGSGDAPIGGPDFTKFARTRRSVPDPAMGQSGSGISRFSDPTVGEPGGDPAVGEPGDPAVGEPGYRPPPDGPAPMDKADAPGDVLAEDVLHITQPLPRSEHTGNGIRPAAGGPPWEPAGKPPGELPWTPTSPAGPRDHGTVPPRPSDRPGGITDVPPPEPPGGTRS